MFRLVLRSWGRVDLGRVDLGAVFVVGPSCLGAELTGAELVWCRVNRHPWKLTDHSSQSANKYKLINYYFISQTQTQRRVIKPKKLYINVSVLIL